MMSVLLLRLAAPLQSWGVASRHNTRTTLPAPSKSGVIGMIANALGRRRTDPVDDLAVLRFGVRVDRAGEPIVDFHTLSGASHAPAEPAGQRLPTAQGSSLRPGDSTKITRRHYLADAVFVVGLEGQRHQLGPLADALRRPRRPLYLGRRSCPPTPPVVLGIVDGVDLREALVAAPSQGGRPRQSRPLVVEDAEGMDALPDQPISFDPMRRQYAARPITYDSVPPGDAPHDPFALWTS